MLRKRTIFRLLFSALLAAGASVASVVVLLYVSAYLQIPHASYLIDNYGFDAKYTIYGLYYILTALTLLSIGLIVVYILRVVVGPLKSTDIVTLVAFWFVPVCASPFLIPSDGFSATSTYFNSAEPWLALLALLLAWQIMRQPSSGKKTA